MRWISEWFAYPQPLNQDQEHIFWWRNRWDTPNLVKIIKFAVSWPFFHGFLQFSSTFWCVNQCNSRVQGPVDMLCTVICLIYTKIPKLNMKNKINLSLWRPTPPSGYIGFQVHIPVPPCMMLISCQHLPPRRKWHRTWHRRSEARIWASVKTHTSQIWRDHVWASWEDPSVDICGKSFRCLSPLSTSYSCYLACQRMDLGVKFFKWSTWHPHHKFFLAFSIMSHIHFPLSEAQQIFRVSFLSS